MCKPKLAQHAHARGAFCAVCRRQLVEESRWVIPPNGTVSLVVQFSSEAVGRFTEMLAFDVVCGERSNTVTLMAACDYPRISTGAR